MSNYLLVDYLLVYFKHTFISVMTKALQAHRYIDSSFLDIPKAYLPHGMDGWYVIVQVVKSIMATDAKPPYFINQQVGEKFFFDVSPKNKLLSDGE